MEISQVMYFVILIVTLLAVMFFVVDRILTYLQRNSGGFLRENGKRVVAIVTDIRQEVEERGPPQYSRINYCYYIEAEWTDVHTGVTYQFRSKRLNSRPIEVPGAFLSVIVDPENPTHYNMELSEEHI